MADTPRLASLIARAIVHLNFNEPDQAKEVLFDALTDFNFTHEEFQRSQLQPSAAKEAA